MHHSPYVAGGDVICDAVVIFCVARKSSLLTTYVHFSGLMTSSNSTFPSERLNVDVERERGDQRPGRKHAHDHPSCNKV
jgi:hypothetical protein